MVLALITFLGSNQLISQEFVYVCNQNSASVSVINVSTLEVETTIDFQELGFQRMQNHIMPQLNQMGLSGTLHLSERTAY